MPDKLIAVSTTSRKESSLRMTLPKEVAEKLNVSESEHIGFFEVRGKIVVRKIE
jgi:antitoxin component of MazEF toxin-antitoxin module